VIASLDLTFNDRTVDIPTRGYPMDTLAGFSTIARHNESEKPKDVKKRLAVEGCLIFTTLVESRHMY
jgi:hypothetical protein